MSDATPFFPTIEWALAVLPTSVEEIARAVGSLVEEFDDDGLGQARATGIHLPSGAPVSFKEHLARLDVGTAIFVDATDLGSDGVETLLEAVLAAIGCERNALTWIQDPRVRELASRQAAWAIEYRRSLEAGEPLPEMPNDSP